MFVVDCQDDVTGPAVVDQDHLSRASLGSSEFLLDSPVYQEGHLFVNRGLFVVPGDDYLAVTDVSFSTFISRSCSEGCGFLSFRVFDPDFGLLLDVEALCTVRCFGYYVLFNSRFGWYSRCWSRFLFLGFTS